MDRNDVIQEIKEIIPKVAPGVQVILYQSDAHRGEDHPENIFDLVVVLDKNNVSDEDEDAIFTPLENIEDRSNYTMAILPRIYSKSQWNYYRAVSPLYYETIMNRRGGKFICQ